MKIKTVAGRILPATKKEIESYFNGFRLFDGVFNAYKFVEDDNYEAWEISFPFEKETFFRLLLLSKKMKRIQSGLVIYPNKEIVYWFYDIPANSDKVPKVFINFKGYDIIEINEDFSKFISILMVTFDILIGKGNENITRKTSNL